MTKEILFKRVTVLQKSTKNLRTVELRAWKRLKAVLFFYFT